MKKVKIMLTAVVVFAAIGGALAFKAQKFGSVIYTTTNEAGTPRCPLEKFDFTTTSVETGTKISVSTVKNGFCVLTWTKPQI